MICRKTGRGAPGAPQGTAALQQDDLRQAAAAAEVPRGQTEGVAPHAAAEAGAAAEAVGVDTMVEPTMAMRGLPM